MRHLAKILKACAVAVCFALFQVTACSAPVFVGFSPPDVRHHLSLWDILYGVAIRLHPEGVLLFSVFYFLIALGIAYTPRIVKQVIACITAVLAVVFLVFTIRVILDEIRSEERYSYPFFGHASDVY